MSAQDWSRFLDALTALRNAGQLSQSQAVTYAGIPHQPIREVASGMANITIMEILHGIYPDQVKALLLRGLAAQPGGYVLAVDFDGTLCKNAWPDIGPGISSTIRDMRKAQEQGIKVILWTCREGDSLQAAVDWCREKQLVFDAINSNPPERIQQYGTDPRKIGYDELWDDRAIGSQQRRAL